ncbi:hypothetical protein VQL36_05995 [Chengkuizengella sp. SCS-71B]|uniref:hypothetical protein n=1 Tax=Chengkuizengella sp. SCS-71B TaxID=3115290 RepID=UPI0032C23472
MFKKTSLKKSITMTALAVGFGLVGLMGASLAGGEKSYYISQETKEAKLFEQARTLDLKTDGKSFDELLSEVQAAQLFKDAETLGIEKYGKSIDELSDEVWEAKLVKYVGSLDISIETDGKSFDEVYKEFKVIRFLKQAETLGIEVNEKSFNEVIEAYQKAFPEVVALDNITTTEGFLEYYSPSFRTDGLKLTSSANVLPSQQTVEGMGIDFDTLLYGPWYGVWAE